MKAAGIGLGKANRFTDDGQRPFQSLWGVAYDCGGAAPAVSDADVGANGQQQGGKKQKYGIAKTDNEGSQYLGSQPVFATDSEKKHRI